MAARTDHEEHYLRTELFALSKQSHVVLDFLASGSLDGLWYRDLEDPAIEWMSPSFWVTLGYDPAERQHLVSEWQDLIDPADLELASEALRAHCADEDQPYDLVVRYRHRDGSTVWVRCRGVAIRDERGRAIRMLGAHTDLTAAKKGEARLQGFVDALPGLALVLSEKGRCLDILSANGGLPIVDGHLPEAPSDELIGTMICDVMPRETADMLLSKACEVLDRDRAGRIEYSLETASGQRWFEARIVPYPPADRDGQRAVIWIANDVTARVDLHQRSEYRNSELQRLAAILAHDLRAPLRGISHISSWIREDLGCEVNDRVQGHLVMLQDRLDRMNALITGVSSLSQAAREVHLQPVSLDREIRAVWSVFAPDAPGFRLEIVGEFPTLLVDRTLFARIAQNLIGNALDHHDQEQGVVTVRTAPWGRKHVLEFEDDGPGIRAGASERCFDPFQSTKKLPASEVCGLGLTIAKKCAEELGGELMLVPSDGRGATFRVTLPAMERL